MQPVALAGVGQRRRDAFGRQAGALGEGSHRHAVDQAQRVQHVLEREFGAAHHVGAAHACRAADHVHIGARMAGFPAPMHQAAGRVAELAVGAGADAQVIAELPVVEVVHAAPVGSRVGRDFVLTVAGSGEPGLAGFLHRPGMVVVRQRRRVGGERGVRFERQLIVRDVRGLQRHRALHVGQCAVQRLLRQRVHQVQIDVGVAGILRRLHCGLGLTSRVDATEPLQFVVVEALHAERNAVDAGRQVTVEATVFDGAGIGFQGDLGVIGQRQARAHAVEQAVDQLRRKQAGCAATEKNTDDRSTFECRGEIDAVGIQISQQMIDVVGVRRRLAAQAVRIEIAVRALLHAPRHVDVQRQRWRDQTHACSSRSRACSNARAWPRWLSRFFSASSISATLWS